MALRQRLSKHEVLPASDRERRLRRLHGEKVPAGAQLGRLEVDRSEELRAVDSPRGQSREVEKAHVRRCGVSTRVSGVRASRLRLLVGGQPGDDYRRRSRGWRTGWQKLKRFWRRRLAWT